MASPHRPPAQSIYSSGLCFCLKVLDRPSTPPHSPLPDLRQPGAIPESHPRQSLPRDPSPSPDLRHSTPPHHPHMPRSLPKRRRILRPTALQDQASGPDFLNASALDTPDNRWPTHTQQHHQQHHQKQHIHHQQTQQQKPNHKRPRKPKPPLSHDLIITHVSANTLEPLGLRPEDLLGRSFLRLISDPHALLNAALAMKRPNNLNDEPFCMPVTLRGANHARCSADAALQWVVVDSQSNIPDPALVARPGPSPPTRPLEPHSVSSTPSDFSTNNTVAASASPVSAVVATPDSTPTASHSPELNYQQSQQQDAVENKDDPITTLQHPSTPTLPEIMHVDDAPPPPVKLDSPSALPSTDDPMQDTDASKQEQQEQQLQPPSTTPNPTLFRLMVEIDIASTRPPRPASHDYHSFEITAPDGRSISLPTISSGFYTHAPSLVAFIERIESFLETLTTLEQTVVFIARMIYRLVAFDQISVYRLGDEKDLEIVYEEERDRATRKFNPSKYKAAKFAVSSNSWNRAVPPGWIRNVQDIHLSTVPILTLPPQVILPLGKSILRVLEPFQVNYVSKINSCAVYSLRLRTYNELWSLTMHSTAAVRIPFGSTPLLKYLATSMSKFTDCSTLKEALNVEIVLADKTMQVFQDDRVTDCDDVTLIPGTTTADAAGQSQSVVSHPLHAADASTMSATSTPCDAVPSTVSSMSTSNYAAVAATSPTAPTLTLSTDAPNTTTTTTQQQRRVRMSQALVSPPAVTAAMMAQPSESAPLYKRRKPFQDRQSAAQRLATCVSHFLSVFSADAAIIHLYNDTQIIHHGTGGVELEAIGDYFTARRFKHMVVSRCCERDLPDVMINVDGRDEGGGDNDGDGIAQPNSTRRCVFNEFSGIIYIPLSITGENFICFLRQQNPEYVRSYHDDSTDSVPVNQPSQLPSALWTMRDENVGRLLQVIGWSFIRALKEQETGVRNEQLKSVILANASHEIRTPLNAIINFLDMMVDDVDNNDTTTHCAITSDVWKFAYDASISISHIIDEFLLLTSAGWGSIHIYSQAFRLRDSVASCAGMFALLAKTRGLAFSVEFPPTVCRSDHDGDGVDGVAFSDLVVVGDEGKLRQILTNMLSNAIKYTERGFVRLVVRARRSVACGDRHAVDDADAAAAKADVDHGVDCGNGTDTDKIHQHDNTTDPQPNGDVDANAPALHVDFCVQDTGMGIPKDKLPRVFDAFERIEDVGSKRKQIEGVGLGLAICSELAKFMHGSITVESEEGAGSTFTLSLPLPIAAP